MTTAPAQAARALPTHEQFNLDTVFQGEIRRVRKSPLYGLALLIVAIAMVLLPLLYLALVAAVGYAVYWHAVNDIGWLTSSGASRFKLFAYATPLVVGVILICFMLKPLLARPGREMSGLALRREDQPRLFAFVERLCAILGAPRPREIKVNCDVNASASFRRGFLSMLGNDLTLTIGLPLVAGMNLRQLTGVLAHEFGHFAQGVGMRLTYIIQSINQWFARIVYARDAWDEQLIEASKSDTGMIAAIGWLARGMVWLTRQVLKLFMYTGLAISSFMSRRMEFDADRYEARVAGADVFEQTSNQLHCLGIASQMAFNRLNATWREKRLAEDLPGFVLRHAERIPPPARELLIKSVNKRKTGWFDSHPATADRIASARREQTDGIIQTDAPATALFDNFAALCHTLTYVHYRDLMGDELDQRSLVPNQTLLDEATQQAGQRQSLRKLYGAGCESARPFVLRNLPEFSGESPNEIIKQIAEARRRAIALGTSLRESLKTLERTHEQQVQLEQADALRRANVMFRPAEFGLSSRSAEEIERKRDQIRSERSQPEMTVQEMETLASLRIGAAVRLLGAPAVAKLIENAAALRQEGERLIALGRRLAECVPVLLSRHIDYVVAITSGNALSLNEDNMILQSQLRSRAGTLHQLLADLRAEWNSEPYPFEHATKASIGVYLVEQMPQQSDIGAVIESTGVTAAKALELNERVLTRLADIALQVEDKLQEVAKRKRDAAQQTPSQ